MKKGGKVTKGSLGKLSMPPKRKNVVVVTSPKAVSSSLTLKKKAQRVMTAGGMVREKKVEKKIEGSRMTLRQKPAAVVEKRRVGVKEMKKRSKKIDNTPKAAPENKIVEEELSEPMEVPEEPVKKMALKHKQSSMKTSAKEGASRSEPQKKVVKLISPKFESKTVTKLKNTKALKQAGTETKLSEEDTVVKTLEGGTKRTGKGALKLSKKEQTKTSGDSTRENGTEEAAVKEPQKRKRSQRAKAADSSGKNLERKTEEAASVPEKVTKRSRSKKGDSGAQVTEVGSVPEKTSKRDRLAKKDDGGQETDVENAPTKTSKRVRSKKEKKGAQMSATMNAMVKKRDQQKKENDDAPKEKKDDHSDVMIIDLPDKLLASRFRYINEKLYTCTGEEAERFFAEDSSAFAAYHAGFTHQMAKWPENPLESVFDYIKRNVDRKATVVDMGAGEARLHARLNGVGFRSVYSFDLVALNKRVTVANMNNIPLESNSVDTVVFCLSLMGKNLAEYLREANRLLKKDGRLIIAEIRSRFTSVPTFITALKSLGFTEPENAQSIDKDIFLMLVCSKIDKPQNRRPIGLKLEPCLYKKR